MPTASASTPIIIELKTSENSATAILPIVRFKFHALLVLYTTSQVAAY